MRELFVWYRIDAVAAARARAAVEAMHARLRAQHPGLVARLLVRAGDGPAPETWMETYALPGASGGIDARLESGIEAEASAWAHLLAGPRHVEAFATPAA
jgi:hypothetical protein